MPSLARDPAALITARILPTFAPRNSSDDNGARNWQTSPRPHRPPYDSTPILIRRVRRRRQRLRSNGSFESDPASQPQRSMRAHVRRVTPDRVLPLVGT